MEIESSTKCVDCFKLKEINDEDKVLDLSWKKIKNALIISEQLTTIEMIFLLVL